MFAEWITKKMNRNIFGNDKKNTLKCVNTYETCYYTNFKNYSGNEYIGDQQVSHGVELKQRKLLEEVAENPIRSRNDRTQMNPSVCLLTLRKKPDEDNTQ